VGHVEFVRDCHDLQIQIQTRKRNGEPNMLPKYRPAFFAAPALCAAFSTVNLQAAAVEHKPAVKVSIKDMPHLEKRDGMTKLIVDGHPFICIAGELSNTASSDREATKATIARLAQANFNTILTVVSWDLVEPEEGKFDFSMIDYQIEAARANNVRLVFLWMGSWKNGLSHFPPLWVKANQDRFPRVVNGQGKTLEILSTLSDSNRNADALAFAAVMKHIREVDKTHTVIAIQVENEVGAMGTTRDFRPAANAAFAGPVPKELTGYLQQNREHLLPELKKIWDAAGDKTGGTWGQVFGKNVQRPADDPPVPNNRTRPARPANIELANRTDEIFMAWNYSRYIGYVAAQGKKEYPIPMYVNTWLVQPNDLGAGDYPSGGPEPLVHDIWRAGAPAIDILAPDIYQTDYSGIIQTFSRGGNPAWNPETGLNANNAWMGFTQLKLLCFSPFGVDGSLNTTPDNPFVRSYAFLNSISGAIAEAQGKPDAIKLIELEPEQNPGKVVMGRYIFDFTPMSGAGRRGAGALGSAAGGGAAATATPAAPQAQGRGATVGLSFLDKPFLLIIHTAPDEYYFAANAPFPFVVSPNDIPNARVAAPAIMERGAFKNGIWVMQRRVNGDDIMGRGYDVSAAANNNLSGSQIPLGARGRGTGAANSTPQPPAVMRVRFYQYR
jgi:Domain of unknown function (DUF5597)/Beta-galactosidase